MTDARLLIETNGYTFTRSGSSYYLKVLCGSIGLYEITIELDREELKDYGEWVESFIDGLARKVAYSPETFIKRSIHTAKV